MDRALQHYSCCDEIWPAVSGSLREDKILTATAQAESFETAEVVVVEGGGLVLDETATFDTGKTTFGMRVQLVLQIRDAAAIIETGADGAGMVQLLANRLRGSTGSYTYDNGKTTHFFDVFAATADTPIATTTATTTDTSTATSTFSSARCWISIRSRDDAK